MVRRAAVLFLALSSCTSTPSPPDGIEVLFRRFDELEQPYVTRKAEDFERLPKGYQSVVSLFPVGYWGLLIDAYPDRAFERYAPMFERDEVNAVVPRWALVRLAEHGHRPTLDFFRGRLDHPDRYQRGLAVRMLAHSGDASLAPRLLRMIPDPIKDGDDGELAGDVLAAVTGFRPCDEAVLDPLLKRLGTDAGWHVGSSTFARFAVTRATDPVAAADRILQEDRREDRSWDRLEGWLSEFALRHRLTAMAPLLRRRVKEEIDSFRENGLEDQLNPREPMLPQFDGIWGFRGPFVLASYRVALRDLGVPLTAEEREWLESQRLLRPARDYLGEAGYLPR